MAYLNTSVEEVSLENIRANEANYRHWDYQSIEPISTGYEDLYPNFQRVSSDEFQAMSPGEQDAVVEEMLQLYRSRNIFPNKYYSELQVIEEIQKCIEYVAEFDGDTVQTGVGIGTGLCNFYFPNLYDTPSQQDEDKRDIGANTMHGRFLNDDFLRKSIRFCYSYKGTGPVPLAVQGGMRLVGSAPSNFRPMNAQAIWERFAPEGGVVYDHSTGFGGRLVGALTSKKNLTYVGVDPNTESMYNLHRLAEKIESVTGRTGSYELHCVGSEVEDLVGEKESWADVSFSSPPYFSLEMYGEGDLNESNQSHVKFPGLDGWLEGFVRGTCRNIYKILKPGGYSVVNIADFNSKDYGRVSFVDEWKMIAEEEGLDFYTNIFLGVQSRAGSLEQDMNESKKEVILVFKSRKPMWG